MHKKKLMRLDEIGYKLKKNNSNLCIFIRKS